jgi:hypothetical protein
MEYEDSDVDLNLDNWYRVVLVQANGTRDFSTPVGVTFGRLRSRTRLQVPFQPGNDIVKLRYAIGGPRVPVRLEIFDVAGKLVASLDQGVRGPGEYVQPWPRLDASRRAVARGVYLVRLVAGRERDTQKLLLAH